MRGKDLVSTSNPPKKGGGSFQSANHKIMGQETLVEAVVTYIQPQPVRQLIPREIRKSLFAALKVCIVGSRMRSEVLPMTYVEYYC